MVKIPVGETIGKTISFAFGNYKSVLGIVWLPLLLIGVSFFFVMAPLIELFRIAAHHSPQSIATAPNQIAQQIQGWAPAVQLAALLLLTIIRVGIVKEALGVRKGPRFAYLWFGAAELRAVGAYLILMALAYVSILAVVLVGGGAGVLIYLLAKAAIQAHVLPDDAMDWFRIAAIAAGIIVAGVWVYFAVRLSYLIVPVIVAEKQIGIRRSWELSRGNFWRIVGVSVPLFLIVLSLELLVMLIVVAAISGFVEIVGHDWFRDQFVQNSGPSSALMLFALCLGAVGIFVLPVFYGLTMSPAAFAYRALVPVKDDKLANAPASMLNEGMHP